jgi:uncharacterized protein YbjQ (UPF0145 family)
MPCPSKKSMTQTEALEEARQRLGKDACVAVHFGTHKIGYATEDHSFIVVGRGKSWEQAFRNSFNIADPT